MSKESGRRSRAEFVEQLQAANNSIMEEVATDIYNVLDTVQILLAIPKGQRIVVNKKKRDGTN